LRYADTLGVSAIVSELKRLEKKLQAQRFQPAAYLLKLQENGKKFYSA
jgi:hypothetical protein